MNHGQGGYVDCRIITLLHCRKIWTSIATCLAVSETLGLAMPQEPQDEAGPSFIGVEAG